MHSSKQTPDPLKDRTKEISVEEVRKRIKNADFDLRFVDIREERERLIGYIGGALHLPDSILAAKIEESLPDKEAPVVLYCSSGVRSIKAAALMEGMGYGEVKSMAGGFNAWVEAGYAIVTKGTMTADQVHRYSRQMLLPEIGEEGQLKLLRSRVLLVGAGGLGSPIAIYLAAGGIGGLGIVDFDRVGLSNIHRQVLYGTSDVGRPKTESAREQLQKINPDIAVTIHQERFTSGNALKLIEAYDVVVDGSDNPETKFLLNDAAFFAGKPYVFGGAVGFGGQASVFFPKEGGPCMRCMIPEMPQPGTVPTCSEVGVFGIVPGQIGMVQAGEVVKLILGIGKTLMGRFLVYDCLQAEFRTLTVTRDPSCPLCGETPTIMGI
jgi:molybdopterin/thiamine biosynthesis adenylyltransferase/rhodanese-related sulfurtransferase